MANVIMVTMGELHVSSDPYDVLVALGLGSCIGLCAYDAQNQVAGMAHLVLPSPTGQAAGSDPKYASVGVPALINAMVDAGASRPLIQTALIGGAHLFAGTVSSSSLAIGSRNVEATLAALKEIDIRPVLQDTGGESGRTVHLYALDGRIRLKTLGKGEVELGHLNHVSHVGGRRAA
jgi:chemotaxis protein CheD